jgi:hypothetical protein
LYVGGDVHRATGVGFANADIDVSHDVFSPPDEGLTVTGQRSGPSFARRASAQVAPEGHPRHTPPGIDHPLRLSG